MPTSVGPNTKGEENLVFGFDTGDTVNSYKGEPTVNLFPDPTYTSTDGFIQNNTVYTRKPGQGYDGLDSVEGVVSSSYVSGQIERRWSINLSPGFYTHTFYVKKNCDFKRIEHLGTAQVTSGGSSQQQFSVDVNAGTVNPNPGFTDYDIQDYGDWWKVWYKIEISGSGNAIFDYEPYYEVGNRFEFCGSQIEAKTHPTPFTPDTRSATEGLIDLIGTSTIDLTNVSFDSNAQMTFDGTDDMVTHDAIQFLSGSSYTLSQWQQFDSNANTAWQAFCGDDRFVVGESVNNGGFYMWHSNGQFWWYQSFDNPTYYGVISQTLSGGNIFDRMIGESPFSVDVTFEGSTNTMKIYINGELEATATPTWAPGLDRITFDKIGGSSTRRFAGNIPTQKIYSRALTASEIKANYNAIKGRFNI